MHAKIDGFKSVMFQNCPYETIKPFIQFVMIIDDETSHFEKLAHLITYILVTQCLLFIIQVEFK